MNTGKPKSGFEFINKKTLEGISIYHLHLSNLDKSILFWYIEEVNNNLFIKFKYEKEHPKDDYKNIIKEMFNNPKVIHLEKGDYIINYPYLLKYNVDENIILKFADFKILK